MRAAVVNKLSILQVIFLILVGSNCSSMAQNAPTTATYRDYALSHDGNPARGKELFMNEQKAACSKCHSTDGTSRLAGPDLFAIGDKFPKADLIRSVLEPSATIAVGYGTTIVERKSGEDVQGVIKTASDTAIEMMGADGKMVRIPTAEIRQQRTSALSLMPEGLQLAMSPAEFTDLIAYLETLRQPTNGLASAGEMPEPIPRATKAVSFLPFFRDNIKLTRPVWFGRIPGTPNAFLVLEHGGKIWMAGKGTDRDTQSMFLDLTGEVRVGGATGLLGLAFHPKFLENRRYFLKYHIVENGKISTLIVERRFAKNQLADSGTPSRQLLKVPATTQDHNGGCIEFGPDGYLYIGMGDTGPQRDPQGHGQDLKLLIGKILRIDVDQVDGERLYGIPKDNPFVNRPEVRPEIWAYGFREPWRFTFDTVTKDLWVGDVGQDQYEEVAIVKAGENHGWNVYEGFTPFSNRYRSEGAKYIAPVLSYSHRQGVSVTGGYVYHGKRAPQMEGWYVFGDFQSRRLWALTHQNRELTKAVEIGLCPTRLVSFMQDADGELYAVGYDSGTIYKLDLSSVNPTPLQVHTLAETSEKIPVRWRYAEQISEGWMRPDFDDSRWLEGPGGFGTRGTPAAVVRTEWRSDNIWLRREFTLGTNDLLSAQQSLGLRIHHDEEAEVYLNGVEVVREPRWTSGYTELPLGSNAVAALRPGRNILAIHCRQHTGGQYIDAGLIEYIVPSK
jgi:putative heme-binding domain-containing protein